MQPLQSVKRIVVFLSYDRSSPSPQLEIARDLLYHYFGSNLHINVANVLRGFQNGGFYTSISSRPLSPLVTNLDVMIRLVRTSNAICFATLAYLNEFSLTSPTHIASHIISRRTKTTARTSPFATSPPRTTRYCNDIPYRDNFSSCTQARQDAGTFCFQAATHSHGASPFWHSLRIPDPRRHSSGLQCHCTSALPTKPAAAKQKSV